MAWRYPGLGVDAYASGLGCGQPRASSVGEGGHQIVLWLIRVEGMKGYTHPGA